MSALAMILTATMAVVGNGPEKVSDEVEQRLDLKGEWEGTWNTHLGKRFLIRLTPTEFHLDNGETTGVLRYPMSDEGNGKLRFRGRLGIYQQDGDRLLICLAKTRTNQRPTSFRIDEGQHLLLLHRVKLRK